MDTALAVLGHPERRLGRVLHVGGTNGKGSTAAMLEAMLRAAGVRTGLYTSPHLHRFTERIRIAGEEVAPETLVRHRLRASDELTFFEHATLLALACFAEAGTDVTILEVGLGGRLDATNVVDADVAVVTSVSRDHEDVLGEGIPAIAGEKAGIFKPGRAAVIGDAGEARPLLEAAARAAGAEPAPVGEAEPWPCALAGAHQARNQVVARAALDALEARTPVRVPEAARRRGLETVHWPGRLERLPGGVVVDAAHNPAGAQALVAALPDEPRALVVGVSEDKDAGGIVAPLLERAARIYATRAPSPRALAPAALAARIPRRDVVALDDPLAALAAARETGLPVVVFGSLFLVAAVRAELLGEEVDEVSLQDPR
jgi:dihydrofolate synthase/folylpolyglutamate synthase